MSLTDWLFGCSHESYSFPLTVKIAKRPAAAKVTGTYVVCTNCGKEFPYSWEFMKIVSEKPTEQKLVEARNF